MKRFIREKVSGKRNRLKTKEFDLDLSYISDRIIAMSFPASKAIQQCYRNDIAQVSRFLDAKHPGKKYWIYNLSNKKIEEHHFSNQVNSYDWEDHHSPSLLVLF